MAGAKIDVLLLQKIDVASEVRTNRIEGLDLIASAAQINGANGDLGEFVPGVDPIGQHRKFAGNAIVGERFEPGDADGRAGPGFSAERIKENL